MSYKQGRFNHQKADRVAVVVLAALIAIGFFIAFIAPLFAAKAPTFQQPVFIPPEYMAGCEVTERHDDGGKVLYCPEDGDTYIFDPDGQRWSNEAGAPIRPPGWYVVK